jgi:hypothetical protein
VANKLSFRALTVLFVSLFATTSSWGYFLQVDESGVYVIKWQASPITMQVKLSATANLSDGTSQRSSVVAAM